MKYLHRQSLDIIPQRRLLDASFLRVAAVSVCCFLALCTVACAESAWPESLNAAKGKISTDPTAFVEQSLENYKAELQAMRELYLSLGGALPSDAESFFSTVTISDPPEFTIQVEADVLSNPLPAADTDDRPAGVINRLYGTLSETQTGSSAAHSSVVRSTDSFLRTSGIETEQRIDVVLAADGVTADLLGLPRLVYVHVSAETLTFFPDGSGYKYGNSETKAVYEVKWGEGLVGESNGKLSRVFGDKPGVYDIYAIGYNVFKDTEKNANGRIVKVNTYPSKRFDIARALVVKAESLVLDSIDPANSAAKLVAIRTPASSYTRPHYRSLAITTGVNSGSGSKDVSVAPDKTVVEMLDDRGVYFDRKSDNLRLYFGDSLPGASRFRLKSAAAGETSLYSPVYTAGVNTIQVTIDPEPDENGFVEGTDYMVRAVAEGGAPMDGWQGTWEGPMIAEKNVYRRWTMGENTLQGDISGEWGSTESFVKTGDAWEISTPLRINGLAENDWNKEQLSRAFAGDYHADDCPNIAFRLRLQASGDADEHTLDFPTYTDAGGTRRLAAGAIHSPAMAQLNLQARHEQESSWHPAPVQMHVFTSSRARALPSITFRAGADFANGVAVDPIPPDDNTAFSLLFDPPGILHAAAPDTYTVSRNEASGTAVTVRAQAAGERVQQNGLSLEPGTGELLSEPCTVIVNRLVLGSMREGDKLTYRLIAFGSADMSAYRARWNLRILNPRSQDYASGSDFQTMDDGSALSTCEMGFTNNIANGYLLSVEVLDANGTAVAELEGGAALNDTTESSESVSGSTEDVEDNSADTEVTNWTVTEVTVVNVVNRNGNNPFLAEDPVDNENGSVIDDGDGGNAGAGQYAKYKLSADGKTGEATLLYDPATDFCELRSGLGGTDTRAVDIYMFPVETRSPGSRQRGGARPWISISNAVMQSIWDGGGFWEGVAAGQFISFTLIHKPTGSTYLVTIKVDVVLTGGVTLISIQKTGRR